LIVKTEEEQRLKTGKERKDASSIRAGGRQGAGDGIDTGGHWAS
jgi:hypothetical protein